MATVSGLEFSDDGVLTVTPRPGEGVPDTAQVMGGWAADQTGAAYIEAASAVPSNAVQVGGLSYTQDGALYVTSAAPSNPVYIGGRAVRQDGALHVKTGTPSGDDQALGGWMTSNAGVAYVDLLPSFWLPLADAGDGEVDITLGMGTGSGTFTRATTATTVDSTGMIVSVASGVPRSYYDPTTLEYRGYIAEGARTNLCLQSETLLTTWSGVRATPTTDATVISPMGGDSFKLTESIDNNSHLLRQVFTKAASAIQYTATMWFKAGSRSWAFLQMGDTGIANFARAWFDLSLGVVGTTTTGGASPFTSVSSSIKGYPNGWYRCAITFTTNTDTVLNMDCCLSTGDGTVLYQGDGSSYLNLIGGGLEEAPFASSYIPTTTASVTRNADVLTYPSSGNALASVGTAYGEIALLHTPPSAAAFPCWLDINDGSADNRIFFLLYNNVGDRQAYETVRSGASLQANVPASVGGVFTDPLKHAGRWIVDSVLCCADTTLSLADTTATMPVSISTITVGSNFTGNSFFGTIKNIRIWTTQFSAAQLQAATA